jgi:hypothetical protein
VVLDGGWFIGAARVILVVTRLKHSMATDKRQFSLTGILAYTAFVAVAISLSLQHGRGIFFPAVFNLAAVLGFIRSETNAKRVYWAKFAIGVCVYVIFVSALDRYFDHLVWRVFRPQGRFSRPTYNLIETGTVLFPIAFHAIGAWLNGWLAANATRLLLTIWLSATTFWAVYPLTSIRSEWINPLFNLTQLPWPSYTFAAFLLITSSLSLFGLYLLSSPSNDSRVRRTIARFTTGILVSLICILVLGMR